MSDLSFDEFFSALHPQAKPFPWQRWLAERVLGGKGWPSVIALPTAAGKTAVMDIAVFALAAAPEVMPQPRRVFYVVDRRVIVDAAYERASSIARRLMEALDGERDILREVAERLVAHGGEVPLQVAALRGGVYRDHAWARSPAQPLVCVSTVDQVGSRLLFRGYGLGSGPGSPLPIHAALVANDALVILDEAHISRPFEETLDAVSRYRSWAEVPIGGPWHVVRMSATPDTSCKDVFPAPEDRDAAVDHPVLRKRLEARKRASLVLVQTDESKGKALAEEAVRLLDEDARVRVVGVVVNRVATARETFERLAIDHDAVLLIGRSRPLDRDRLLDESIGRIAAGRRRADDDRPLFAVATQCIEVGADLDFDALVTECAPLDALRQRFGRLDRFGELGVTSAVIAVGKDEVGAKALDPIYGRALAETWHWLKGRVPTGRGAEKVVDLGVRSLDAQLPTGDEAVTLSTPRRSAPVMLPAHMDRWVQTFPMPQPDPDVTLFLHGPESGPPDVQLVWRCDLPEDRPEVWADVVALVPPSSSEVMSVPFRVARRWLAGLPAGDVADVEAELDTQGDEPQVGRVVLRWRGTDDPATAVIRPGDVRPTDTLVLPSSYGGADRYGWSPDAGPVRDIAEGASMRHRLRAILRLHPAVLRILAPPGGGLERLLSELVSAIEAGDETESLVEQVLAAVADDEEADSYAREAARHLLHDARRRRVLYPDRLGVVLVGSRRLTPSTVGVVFEQITDEDVSSSLTRPVTLAAHTHGVRERAITLARTCRLSDSIAADLEVAATIHDLGKVDPRFQVMLHGGDAIAAAAAEEPLAKSGMNPRNRVALRLARERSGYPAGYRHESASVALATATPSLLSDANDTDLVLHIAASHHACARPFLPPVEDSSPVTVMAEIDGETLEANSAHKLERLDSGVPDRFWSCVRRYGWYGLAYIEAILRLADQRQSEAEAESKS